MKHSLRLTAILLALVALLLSACGSKAPTAIRTVVLDKSGQANPTNTDGEISVSASAEAVPVSKVSLSFPLTGIVKTLAVKAGDQVKAGDVLGTLDTVILEARV